ncbi:MAG: proline--tRNA ligase [Candidatus Omnitrophica bacterium CG11_big_fil_rev_8_21_14_0_20_45_26]|uniref:Proline--tRNA ligase n=1 Tax=Candidatus Abzuiibacterium crystallinum TaxID=1974748 RepID=A0A2H0LT75_9BACT|nr:MAG: proline--tRNA ligase [Candidatus Omnitrophica bacterium CG11_big_fil_rev_8_21_14_0_20_45_26]PIW65453.1 MAG: proline--tRNA ligase [Candidatus Omnitrophica bacterium CG12_big_fil_rev_8_21_14_0_65_45_16]
MLWRETLIPTLRDIPKEAEATSHRLMLKAGYIRKLSAGVYSYLPLGFRVLNKIIAIIRQEMARVHAEEVLLPALHPAELWRRTGRYEALGQDKISFTNRSGQEFVLGPTHEEVITELAGAYVQSYQDLPFSLYQIQTKFRDELRPRFGIVRTKEFIMKDAYSFHQDEADLKQTYQKFYRAYERIMKRCGLAIVVVSADPGIMGGKVSDEFMVISPYGEDHIAISKEKNICVSRDLAFRTIQKQQNAKKEQQLPLEKFETPNLRTVEELCARFKLKANQLVKTILYIVDSKPVAACVPGQSEVNEFKLRKLLNTANVRQATAQEIKRITNAPVGFSGPVGLKDVRIIADADVAGMSNFVTGANEADMHLRHVNIDRDFKADSVADIRYVEEGDCPPDSNKPYQLQTAMEVGHIFQLGTRYTQSLSATYRNEKGETHPIVMGCYGIGVNRLIAASIDQHHDDKGIVFPISIAPFHVHLITVNQKHEPSCELAARLYEQLKKENIDVLYDNRDVRAGVKFNDADLIGMPMQLIIGEKNLAKKMIEIKIRATKESYQVDQEQAFSEVTKQLNGMLEKLK